MANYIAVELGVVERLAPQTARSAGVDEDRVLAGLTRLWHRCWSETSDVITRSQLAGVFGGSRLDELISALVEFGFLDPREGDWRVRGAARYLRLKASRRAGALKTNSARSKSVASERSKSVRERPLNDALPPSTEHRAPKEKKLAGAVAPRPGWQELVASLVALFEAQRGATYAFSGRDAKALGELLDAGLAHEDVHVRWGRALAHAGFPSVSTLHELARFHQHFATDSPRNDVRKAPIEATRGIGEITARRVL